MPWGNKEEKEVERMSNWKKEKSLSILLSIVRHNKNLQTHNPSHKINQKQKQKQEKSNTKTEQYKKTKGKKEIGKEKKRRRKHQSLKRRGTQRSNTEMIEMRNPLVVVVPRVGFVRCCVSLGWFSWSLRLLSLFLSLLFFFSFCLLAVCAVLYLRPTREWNERINN